VSSWVRNGSLEIALKFLNNRYALRNLSDELVREHLTVAALQQQVQATSSFVLNG
jgi:hypothetical protein